MIRQPGYKDEPSALEKIAQVINMLSAGANAASTGMSLFKGSPSLPSYSGEMGNGPTLGVNTNVLTPMQRRYQQIMRF